MAANLAGRAFIPYYEHLMDILNTNEELRNTFTGVIEQILWAAGPIAIGGLAFGPLCAMIGGVAGSVLGYYKLRHDYNSMVTVIRDLTDAQKRELVDQVQELVLDATIGALTLYIGKKAGRKALIKLLQTFASAVKA